MLWKPCFFAVTQCLVPEAFDDYLTAQISAEEAPVDPSRGVFVAKAVEQIHDPVISLVVAMFLIVVGCCWMFFSLFFVNWTSPTITMCLDSFELEETNHN